LSPHFTLKELTASQTASRKGIKNEPNGPEVAALQLVCYNILEPVREHYDKPFSPSSGYRCLELNREIGSKDRSQHIKGQAVDFEIPGIENKELADWIEENCQFDQLILEFHNPEEPNSGWIHCSFVNLLDNRKEYFSV
jgi:uncharacterized protein YcbK (DUF882 family)